MLYNEEHLSLINTVQDFAVNEIHPFIQEWEETGMFPAHSIFKKLGAIDLLGITKSKTYGGMGLDYSYGLAFAEALGHAWDLGVITAIGVQTDMATPAIDRFGTDELKKEFLAPAIKGEYVAAVALSEVGAGSDLAAIKTYARKDGDDYIINGEKMWITNGTQADWMCMLANTSEGKPHQNKSLMIVPMDAKGIHVEKKLEKMGMCSSDTALIHFDNVRIPRKNLIGEMEGLGFMQQMAQFQDERIWGAANAVSGLREALNITIEYCKDRKTFGQALIDNQFIHFKVAELSSEIESLRSLVYRTVDLQIEKNDPFDMEVVRLASMAKFKAGRLSREVLDWCLQFHGGMGYVTETQINRMYRDCRLISIGGGADEIMLGVIAKLEGYLPGKKKDA